jgi:nicotinamide-nucleotide amidase
VQRTIIATGAFGATVTPETRSTARTVAAHAVAPALRARARRPEVERLARRGRGRRSQSPCDRDGRPARCGALEGRVPLLLVTGGQDHTVPEAITNPTLKQYRHSSAVTDRLELEDRGRCARGIGAWVSPSRGTTSGVNGDREMDAPALGRSIVERLAGRRLACAESCTGGLLAQTLAKAEGSSEWFPGGIVTYQKDAKFALLGLEPGPVVTHEAARAMAAGAARLFECEIAVSITGAAGPDPLDGAPAGTVFVGTAVGGDVRSHRHWFPGTPDSVCHRATEVALRDLARHIGEVHVPAAGRGSRA